MDCWVKFRVTSEEGGVQKMLERLIEMVKGRNDEIFVFLDMEEAYDRVNRKKLFEEIRGLIERIYDGSMLKSELDNVTTGWCKSDYGVRQGVPSQLSLLT